MTAINAINTFGVINSFKNIYPKITPKVLVAVVAVIVGIYFVKKSNS